MELPKKYQTLSLLPGKGTPKTERQSVLEPFRKAINALRKQDGYSELSYCRFALIFQGVPGSEVYKFQRECENAKNYGAYFNAKVWPKKR